MNMEIRSERTGRSIDIEGGANAFIPHPLPKLEGLSLDGKLISLLSEADLALGRLDGISELIVEKDLFIMMYIKKEAVWSSQIEGTQASLMDVLEFEGEALRPDAPRDVADVVNYIGALQFGVQEVSEGRGIDLDLIMELHRRLMRDTRGRSLHPREFRKVQNWIGPPGCSIAEAMFVPPPFKEMMVSLTTLEKFISEEREIPPLIKAALVHSQFETIHPFLDGNGRMGRLLIILILLKEGHLKDPLLYLSYYLKKNRSVYYETLQKVREEGDLEGWITFFLKGIKEASDEASKRSLSILSLSKAHRNKVLEKMGRNGPKSSLLLNAMLRRPVLDVNGIKGITGLSYQNANKMASQLEDLGILVEITGQKRNRIYEYKEYLDILEE